MEQAPYLIKILSTVSFALINDSVKYSPYYKSQNNCGLIAQAISGLNSDELYKYCLKDLDFAYRKKHNCGVPSWTHLVSEFWPLTSPPTNILFHKFHEFGFTREDLAYLENLSDPKILLNSDINMDPIQENYVDTEVDGWWIFSSKKNVEKTREVKYFQRRESLNLYLISWIKLLNGTIEKSKVGELFIAGDRYTYRSLMDLEKLKKHFLDYELYEGVAAVQERINNYN